jgi:hypothetical protein
MMTFSVRTAITIAAAAGCLPLSSGVQAQSYTFTKVFDSSAGFEPSEIGCPAINGGGAIAFRARQSSSGVYRVFRADAGGITTIAASTAGFSSIAPNPSMNGGGDVAFVVNLSSGGQQVLRGNGGPLAMIAQTSSGPFRLFGLDTAVNDLGEVAFKAQLDNLDHGLFTGSGGAITVRYLANHSPFTGDNSGPWINNSSQVAVLEFLDSGGSGIFLSQPNKDIVTIGKSSGSIAIPFVPVVNSFGVVAFGAIMDSGPTAILAGNGGRLFTIVDSSGPFVSFGDPSLNDMGAVAFTGSLANGVQGLFVRTATATATVLLTGDILDGSPVSFITACRGALNNLDQLAFDAQFPDGHTAIFRATPAP